LRVGIVGFGGAGMAHAWYFNRVPGCRVTAVFDPNVGGLARARADKHNDGWALFDDLEGFLESDIDVVSVCAPDSTHATYIVAALEHGKHVICEKPLASSLEDCRRILQAVERSDRVAAVLHQMRFIPLYRKVKGILESGELGNAFYLEGAYVHDLTSRASQFDDWRFRENATPLVYSGCHFVDLLRWFANEEAVEVSGFANHMAFPDYPESDCNVILIRFRSGRIAKVVTAFGAKRPQDHSIRIYADQSSVDNNVLLDHDGLRRVIHSPMLVKWDLFERRGRPLVNRAARFAASSLRNVGPVIHSAINRAAWSVLPTSGDYAVQGLPMRTYEHQLGCVRAIRNFVDAIHSGATPECNVYEAARAVAICLAGVEAYRTRTVQQMSDFSFPELHRGEFV
jgi:predicted dehydrogenase